MASDRFELVNLQLGGQLSRKLHAWRQHGRSYGYIAKALRSEGIVVSRATVDNWCSDLGIPANPVNALKTECPEGHPYDDLNTYTYPDGRRECRACKGT
jgi:hypothetical protein